MNMARHDDAAHPFGSTDQQLSGDWLPAISAARVLGEHGHEVVVFEAADRAGGQVLLASALARRRDLRGIIDWRVEELRRHKVDLRLNTFAEREDVLAEEPELVIVASGGLPRNPLTGPGAELTRDTWEVMGGGVRLSSGCRLHFAVEPCSVSAMP